jgi:hypothetical protein
LFSLEEDEAAAAAIAPARRKTLGLRKEARGRRPQEGSIDTYTGPSVKSSRRAIEIEEKERIGRVRERPDCVQKVML